jgi:hypothetical protein
LNSDCGWDNQVSVSEVDIEVEFEMVGRPRISDRIYKQYLSVLNRCHVIKALHLLLLESTSLFLPFELEINRNTEQVDGYSPCFR